MLSSGRIEETIYANTMMEKCKARRRDKKKQELIFLEKKRYRVLFAEVAG